METNDNYRDDKPDKRHDHHHLTNNRAVIGVILVLVGLFLVLRNTGFFPGFIDHIIFSWPMLLITIGAVITIGSSGGKTSGIIVMAVGAFFLIPHIFRETFDVNMFWPSIFIIIGVIFIFSKTQGMEFGFNNPAGQVMIILTMFMFSAAVNDRSYPTISGEEKSLQYSEEVKLILQKQNLHRCFRTGAGLCLWRHYNYCPRRLECEN